MPSDPAAWDRLAQRYAAVDGLHPAEEALMQRLADRWPAISMLDLGVGAGRTAKPWAPLVKRYVGLDYAPGMIALARAAVPERAGAELRVADARDLSLLGNERFDFVHFSYNGIDCVPVEDRPTILREIRRVIHDDGLFFFSSHSVFALPLQGDAFPRLSIARPDKALYKLVLHAYRSVRFALVNRSIDVEAARRIGFARLGDGGHGFRLKLVYVTPEFQIRQLEEAGFAVDEVQDQRGIAVDPNAPGRDYWLYYLSRPASSPSALSGTRSTAA